MTELLVKAFKKASELPAIEQNAIAKWLVDELESEKKWKSLFAESEVILELIEQNKKIAVQIPINTFKKIEEILENYALVQFMKENENDEILGVKEAKSYYDQLEKAP